MSTLMRRFLLPAEFFHLFCNDEFSHFCSFRVMVEIYFPKLIKSTVESNLTLKLDH